MPKDDVFTAGSIAKAYIEISGWYGEEAERIGAKSAIMPCMGMGRILSGISRPDTRCIGIDFQRVSGAVINGIFRASTYDTNVDELRYRKGSFVAGESGIRDLDMRSAGFIDWILEHGTTLDVAVIGMIIPGHTYHGWLDKWTGDINRLWDKFIRVREECKQFIPRPGKWEFHEDDFFKVSTRFTETYDVLVLDLPRLGSGGRESYSTAWSRLNKALGGNATIEPWTAKNYMSNMQLLLSVKSKYILMTWTDGRAPNPSVQQMRSFLGEHAELESETHWYTYGKDIYGWLFKRM